MFGQTVLIEQRRKSWILLRGLRLLSSTPALWSRAGPPLSLLWPLQSASLSWSEFSELCRTRATGLSFLETRGSWKCDQIDTTAALPRLYVRLLWVPGRFTGSRRRPCSSGSSTTQTFILKMRGVDTENGSCRMATQGSTGSYSAGSSHTFKVLSGEINISGRSASSAN